MKEDSELRYFNNLAHFGGSIDVAKKIYQILEYQVEIYGKAWDPKLNKMRVKRSVRQDSMFSLVGWAFPAGLVWMVRDTLAEQGLDVPVIDMREPCVIVSVPEFDDVVNCLDGITLRDYQVSAVRRFFLKTRGIVSAPTGSGKSSIATAAIKIAWEKHGLKCLFLTHKKELLHQTAQDIKARGGIKPAIIGDGSKRLFGPVTVGMVQSIHASLKKEDAEMEFYLSDVDLLIVDECHHTDANTFFKVVQACKNAYYRLGLSATPLMKGKYEDMRLIGATGSVIKKISIEDLTSRDLLAKPFVKFVKVECPALPKKFSWREAYKHGVVENDIRNMQIHREVMELVASGRTVLVLVNEIEHGERLREFIGCPFIHGKLATEVRRSGLAQLQSGVIRVLISSTITDEGVDIPSVGAVVLAGGWKSQVRQYQRIGRGMRPKEGSNDVWIVDFVDLSHKYLARHSMERYKLVRDEPGFQIVSEFPKDTTMDLPSRVSIG